jgi:hypothetical protein
VTHRVVAVNPDGTLVTRGDADAVNDAWGTRQVRVAGLYVATIPWLGQILPVQDASSASFADGVGAAMNITVGQRAPALDRRGGQLLAATTTRTASSRRWA